METLNIKKENDFLFSGPLGTVIINAKKLDLQGVHSYRAKTENKSDISWKFLKEPLEQSNFLNKDSQHNFIKLTKRQSTYRKIKNFLNEKDLPIKSEITISKKNDTQNHYFRSLCAQKLKGISGGFFVYLKIVGIGYRVFLDRENTLTFKLGYSHYYQAKLPKSIKVFLPEPTLICLYGIDKNQVTQVAAKIQAIKKPCAYKGKGIRLIDQQIQLKAAKKK
uniref:Ribosomal protein L6 n=1 Tax=Tetraselmis sp. CCMP 881 TaxID=1812852 RepID=A0A650ARP9_9CHLO|nr:ribosomal protein L6 [Tetraselmis sp. CCMP 881]